MRFEWGPRNAWRNQRAHDVSFEEAAECFADSLAMMLADQRHPDRLVLIGQSRPCGLVFTIYFTTYAEKAADVIRIIRARKATRTERERYEEGDF